VIEFLETSPVSIAGKIPRYLATDA
jgi:hypothetical protein